MDSFRGNSNRLSPEIRLSCPFGRHWSKGKIPMAGMWIMNVGYGDEFAEVLFAAE